MPENADPAASPQASETQVQVARSAAAPPRPRTVHIDHMKFSDQSRQAADRALRAAAPSDGGTDG